MTLQKKPCSHRARAWWGDHLVAETAAAVEIDLPGKGPELYFPLSDVSLEFFHEEPERLTCEMRGSGRTWGAERVGGDEPAGQDDGWTVYSSGADGTACMWNFDDPGPGLEWLKDLAAFDHDRVRVELEDLLPGEEAGRATTKRFPVWGDVSHLVEVMDVQPAGDGSYVSVARTTPRRPVVEGSQMLGQAIVAAGRHAPGRRVVSSQMYFLRGADAAHPLRFHLEEISAGRTFTSVLVEVEQAGRLCAKGILLLDVTSDDAVRHSVAAPDGAGPYGSEPYDMSVLGRDIRVVDAAYTDDPAAPVGPPVIDAWVRFGAVPDDPPLHAGLLAQFTGHMSIAAALRPHEGIGQREAHRTLSTAINSISISFHAPVRADRWMLYRHESTFAGDGMTHSECRVHGEDGSLIASFTVDAMVRRFTPRPGGVDDRTAM